jgi:hypothetical protein
MQDPQCHKVCMDFSSKTEKDWCVLDPVNEVEAEPVNVVLD